MTAMPVRTVARYQQDATLRQLETRIVSCARLLALIDSERALFKSVANENGAGDDGETDLLAVAMEETIFHPQGGGQPSDLGTISSKAENDKSPSVLDVKLVRKLPSGIILHVGSASNREKSFSPSQTVSLKLDNDKRNYHSRLHTAGHILGLAVRRLQLAGALDEDLTEGKANHAPGSSFVEFHGRIGGEHKAAIQQAANDIVSRDLPVLVHWWDMVQVRERCTAVPDVLPLGPGEEMVRVVEVDGLGSYPCGGTHLPSTLDVGEIVVRKIARQKGVTKLSYEVEERGK